MQEKYIGIIRNAEIGARNEDGRKAVPLWGPERASVLLGVITLVCLVPTVLVFGRKKGA